MMASVSLAGMSCRRADAAPDTMQNYMQSHDRFAGTRRTNLITTHAPITQCLYGNSQKKIARRHPDKMKTQHAYGVRQLCCRSSRMRLTTSSRHSQHSILTATITPNTPQTSPPDSVNQPQIAPKIIGRTNHSHRPLHFSPLPIPCTTTLCAPNVSTSSASAKTPPTPSSNFPNSLPSALK